MPGQGAELNDCGGVGIEALSRTKQDLKVCGKNKFDTSESKQARLGRRASVSDEMTGRDGGRKSEERQRARLTPDQNLSSRLLSAPDEPLGQHPALALRSVTTWSRRSREIGRAHV